MFVRCEAATRRSDPGYPMEVGMYRSVTQSESSRSDKRRALRWIEGVVIGLAVIVALTFTFV